MQHEINAAIELPADSEQNLIVALDDDQLQEVVGGMGPNGCWAIVDGPNGAW